jgi:hypothetical protein
MIGFGLDIVSLLVCLELNGIIGKDENSALKCMCKKKKKNPKEDDGTSTSTLIF